MEFKRKVSPSLLAADYGSLGDAAQTAESGGAASLHVDYMDGHYAPNLSFGFDLIPALQKRVKIPLVAHLMISNTEERLADFIKLKPDYIIIQEDTVGNPSVVLNTIRDAGIKNGFALKPDRPVSLFSELLHTIDFLLILGVFPGFGGQKFMKETLSKMKEAHQYRLKHNLSYDIAVDGGVNMETAPEIIHTGANVLVAGTAIYGKPDIQQAIEDFLAL
jgi:ribulose-phosphate 3-epimerase